MTTNLRLLRACTTTDVSERFETQAWLRFKVLVRACGMTHQECADYLKVALRTVQRWYSRKNRIQGWTLMALEQRARECNVRVVEQPREAA